MNPNRAFFHGVIVTLHSFGEEEAKLLHYISSLVLILQFVEKVFKLLEGVTRRLNDLLHF